MALKQQTGLKQQTAKLGFSGLTGGERKRASGEWNRVGFG